MLETSVLTITKICETAWFGWVFVFCELDCLLLIGDGILEVSQLSEVQKAIFLADTKVYETTWFVWTSVIRYFNGLLLIVNGGVKITNFAEALETL
jgi:hypothetical protein